MLISSFMPEKEHFRRALLSLFNQKKKAVESHRLRIETYGEHDLTIRAYETGLRQFKSGECCDKPQKCEDE